QLLKLLLGTGLILVEPDKREKVAGRVKDRVDDWTDVAKDKYEDVVDRFDRVSHAVRGRERVAPKVGTFLLGLGVGVGLGILFASRFPLPFVLPGKSRRYGSPPVLSREFLSSITSVP